MAARRRRKWIAIGGATAAVAIGAWALPSRWRRRAALAVSQPVTKVAPHLTWSDERRRSRRATTFSAPAPRAPDVTVSDRSSDRRDVLRRHDDHATAPTATGSSVTTRAATTRARRLRRCCTTRRAPTVAAHEPGRRRTRPRDRADPGQRLATAPARAWRASTVSVDGADQPRCVTAAPWDTTAHRGRWPCVHVRATATDAAGQRGDGDRRCHGRQHGSRRRRSITRAVPGRREPDALVGDARRTRPTRVLPRTGPSSRRARRRRPGPTRRRSRPAPTSTS